MTLSPCFLRQQLYFRANLSHSSLEVYPASVHHFVFPPVVQVSSMADTSSCRSPYQCVFFSVNLHPVIAVSVENSLLLNLFIRLSYILSLSSSSSPHSRGHVSPFVEAANPSGRANLRLRSCNCSLWPASGSLVSSSTSTFVPSWCHAILHSDIPPWN